MLPPITPITWTRSFDYWWQPNKWINNNWKNEQASNNRMLVSLFIPLFDEPKFVLLGLKVHHLFSLNLVNKHPFKNVIYRLLITIYICQYSTILAKWWWGTVCHACIQDGIVSSKSTRWGWIFPRWIPGTSAEIHSRKCLGWGFVPRYFCAAPPKTIISH